MRDASLEASRINHAGFPELQAAVIAEWAQADSIYMAMFSIERDIEDINPESLRSIDALIEQQRLEIRAISAERE